MISLTIIGCEASLRTDASQPIDLEPLPDYSGAMQRIFDDEFGGLTLGTSLSDLEAGTNGLLSKRILSAQKISVCSVDTVTEGSVGPNLAAIVDLRSPGLSLTSSGPGDCPKLQVAATSFSYSVLRQSGGSLVGKSVVIFVRDFKEDGNVRKHWHVEPDRPEIRASVQNLRGQYQH